MNTLVITSLSLRRYLRDRTALFFVVVLPVLIIVVLGTTIAGFGKFRVAVVDLDGGTLSRGLVSDLGRSSGVDVRRFRDIEAAARSVRRSENVLALVIPAGTDERLRAGRAARLDLLGDATNSTYAAAASAVSSVVADHASTVQAATFAVRHVGGSIDEQLARATAARATDTPLNVDVRSVDTLRRILPEGFSYSAPTMLVLFVFLNSLAAGGGVIASRKLGVYERVLAAPVRPGSIVLGETLCYLLIAVLQSMLIVGVGTLAFGVSWGDPLAAAALIVVWSLVGTGAGVLSGTLFRTPEQAASIGPALGIGFGMLGGCMWPLEIVSGPMRAVGHAFPHAWAIDAWTILLSRGGGIADIGRQLAVLAAFAVGLLAISTVRLGRRIV